MGEANFYYFTCLKVPRNIVIAVGYDVLIILKRSSLDWMETAFSHLNYKQNYIKNN